MVDLIMKFCIWNSCSIDTGDYLFFFIYGNLLLKSSILFFLSFYTENPNILFCLWANMTVLYCYCAFDFHFLWERGNLGFGNFAILNKYWAEISLKCCLYEVVSTWHKIRDFNKHLSYSVMEFVWLPCTNRASSPKAPRCLSTKLSFVVLRIRNDFSYPRLQLHALVPLQGP